MTVGQQMPTIILLKVTAEQIQPTSAKMGQLYDPIWKAVWPRQLKWVMSVMILSPDKRLPSDGLETWKLG